jgi:Plastocyanin-like domain
VLLVSRDDYRNCDASNPIVMFTDGNSTFEFDRVGFFYFISGEPGHCPAGQRMIVRVMAWNEGTSPSGSPTAAPGPDQSSPSSRHHLSAAFRQRIGHKTFLVLPLMVLLFA